jgi:hypothetical protein
MAQKQFGICSFVQLDEFYQIMQKYPRKMFYYIFELPVPYFSTPKEHQTSESLINFILKNLHNFYHLVPANPVFNAL